MQVFRITSVPNSHEAVKVAQEAAGMEYDNYRVVDVHLVDVV